MYLKQLYQHNKLWCGIVVFFIVAQLVINYKKSFVVTPLYHYGMFSSSVLQPDSLQIFEVEINGKLLQPLDFTPQQWDKIILPLNYFYNTKSDTLWRKVCRSVFKITNTTSLAANYSIQLNINNFYTWYQTQLQQILPNKIVSVRIFSATAVNKSNILTITTKQLLH
ncbi:MAG: hypothetical protein H7101_11415 [Deinococcales bacterium]|nr:hypothetical protein [Chitinophagaceae bacterium]